MPKPSRRFLRRSVDRYSPVAMSSTSNSRKWAGQRVVVDGVGEAAPFAEYGVPVLDALQQPVGRRGKPVLHGVEGGFSPSARQGIEHASVRQHSQVAGPVEEEAVVSAVDLLLDDHMVTCEFRPCRMSALAVPAFGNAGAFEMSCLGVSFHRCPLPPRAVGPFYAPAAIRGAHHVALGLGARPGVRLRGTFPKAGGPIERCPVMPTWSNAEG